MILINVYIVQKMGYVQENTNKYGAKKDIGTD